MAGRRSRRTKVRDIADLAGPPLQLISQYACSDEPAKRICNFLLASKALRSAVLEHGTGTAELTYTSAQSLEQVEAIAAWVAIHGHLLGSLDFSTPITPRGSTLFTEEERDAAEKAVASAFSKAASAVAHKGGLQLQTCTLTHASPGIAELVTQLPSHSLTSLTLDILQLESSTAHPIPYITGLSNSLQHLTSLRQLAMHFSSEACTPHTVLDPLLQQLSALTNLTSLALSDVLQTDNLRHLPASLKELSFQIDVEAHSLNLKHLTALTRLDTDEFTRMEETYILPPNLIELYVGDLFDVACVLPLTQLKVLRLLQCNMMHPEAGNLQQLSRLTQLESVNMQYDCECSSFINDAADAWQLLPLKSISFWPWCGDLSHNTIAQLEQLTKLTGLTLRSGDDCKCECTPNDFGRALCKLTNLEKLFLENCVD